MRRVLARFSDRRNSVSSSNSVGKTENCAGRRIWSELRRTRTARVMLVARSRSNRNAGTGTIITNTIATAAIGTNVPPLSFAAGAEVVAALAIVVRVSQDLFSSRLERSNHSLHALQLPRGREPVPVRDK